MIVIVVLRELILPFLLHMLMVCLAMFVNYRKCAQALSFSLFITVVVVLAHVFLFESDLEIFVHKSWV